MGETGGSPTVTLLDTQNPSHNHNATAVVGRGVPVNTNPIGHLLAEAPVGSNVYAAGTSNLRATELRRGLPGGRQQCAQQSHAVPGAELDRRHGRDFPGARLMATERGMPYQMHRIFCATPGDVEPELQVFYDAVADLNAA